MSVKKSVRGMKSVRPRPSPDVDVRTITTTDGPPCPVCGGTIAEESRLEESPTVVRMSPTGVHCTVCGVMFKFRPPDLRRRR